MRALGNMTHFQSFFFFQKKLSFFYLNKTRQFKLTIDDTNIINHSHLNVGL